MAKIPDWEYPILVARRAKRQAAAKHPHGGKTPQPTVKPGTPPAAPAPGYVTIYSIDPWGTALTALLGDQPPNPTGGGGGMQSTPVQGKIPAQVYGGPGQLSMDLALVIDNFTANSDHEGGGLNCNDELDRLGVLYGIANREAPPPVVKLVAAGSVILYQWAQWTIVDVSFGDGQVNENYNRSQQMVTLHLEEFNEPDLIGKVPKGSVPKHRAGKHGKANGSHPAAGGTQHIIVHKGQTLLDVAYTLGMTSWRPLAAAQRPPITDPRSVKAGDVLRLPRGYGALEVVRS